MSLLKRGVPRRGGPREAWATPGITWTHLTHHVFTKSLEMFLQWLPVEKCHAEVHLNPRPPPPSGKSSDTPLLLKRPLKTLKFTSKVDRTWLGDAATNNKKKADGENYAICDHVYVICGQCFNSLESL